jgi:hypothetical protein
MGSTTYFWRVRARNTIGISEWSSLRTFSTATVSILPGEIPQRHARLENGNTIRFQLAQTDRVVVRVLDIRGGTVARLVDEIRTAGDHRVTLPALPRDGVYLLDFRVGSSREVLKFAR